MIGILIKYKEKTMFAKLPKDSAKLEKQLAGIGLDVPLGAVNLSNHNDHGYEIEIFTQDKFDDEIVSHIWNMYQRRVRKKCTEGSVIALPIRFRSFTES